jgi:DnaJ-domain-containing protein 1
MYTNAKDQVSLEEAYRMVHFEEKETDELAKQDSREGLSDSELEKLEAEEECSCDKKDCDCKKDLKESLVDIATSVVQNDNPSQVVAELARWAFAIGGAIATGTLFANQEKAAQYIAELMHILKFNSTIKEIEQDLKSDDIQKLKDAHNKKINLLRVLVNNVIKKAVEMGLLKDPHSAYDSLEKVVDIVNHEVSKIERM